MSKLTEEIVENTHIEEDNKVDKSVTVINETKTIEEVKGVQPQPMMGNIVNLDMSEAARTKIWVNGDATKVLELNLTDMGIVTRFSEVYPKLLTLQDKIRAIINDGKPEELGGIEDISNFASQFKGIDKEMRDYVDYIFDFKVCDICCDGGSMYDLVAGGFWRFEYIIDKIGNLYHLKLGEEMKKNEQRMNMHTDRYTGKAKYTKKRTTRK